MRNLIKKIIGKKEQKVNKSDPFQLIFKSSQSAFEYICEYVEFPSGLMPGVVINNHTTDEKINIEINVLRDGEIFNPDRFISSLNYLKTIKTGALVLCQDLFGNSAVSIMFVLAPEFNSHTGAWKIISSAADFIAKEA